MKIFLNRQNIFHPKNEKKNDKKIVFLRETETGKN